VQLFVKRRHTLEAPITFETPTIDVGDIAFFVMDLTIHSINGTLPSVDVQARASDDLETWDNVGNHISATAAGGLAGKVDAKQDMYGRYVRFEIQLSGGVNPSVCYSLAINTHRSS